MVKRLLSYLQQAVYWAKHHLSSHSSAEPASRLLLTLGGRVPADL